MFSPAVISSRTARKDLDTIKFRHGVLLQDMAKHAVKLEANRQMKAAEEQAQNTMQTEMNKDRMTATTEARKTATDFALRQGELDIKRSQLTTD